MRFCPNAGRLFQNKQISKDLSLMPRKSAIERRYFTTWVCDLKYKIMLIIKEKKKTVLPSIWNHSYMCKHTKKKQDFTRKKTRRNVQEAKHCLLKVNWLDLPMMCCWIQYLSQMQVFVIPWSPLSMGVSRKEYWGGWPCPPPGDLPDPRDCTQLSHIAGGFFTI